MSYERSVSTEPHDLAGMVEEDVGWLAEQTVDIQQRPLRCNPAR